MSFVRCLPSVAQAASSLLEKNNGSIDGPILMIHEISFVALRLRFIIKIIALAALHFTFHRAVRLQVECRGGQEEEN